MYDLGQTKELMQALDDELENANMHGFVGIGMKIFLKLYSDKSLSTDVVEKVCKHVYNAIYSKI